MLLKRCMGPGMVTAAVAVGVAVHLRDGEYTPAAMALITVALLSALAAVCSSERETGERTAAGDRSLPLPLPLPLPLALALPLPLPLPLAAGLAVEFALLFLSWPAGVDQVDRGAGARHTFVAGLAVAAALAGIGLLRSLGVPPVVSSGITGGTPVLRIPRRPFNPPWFPLLLAVHFFLAAWMVRSSPRPHIDVWVFQQGGAEELSRGHNPYAMHFPDIYESTLPGHQSVYGPGLSKGGVLQFGFPYPPLSLLLSWAGYAASAVASKVKLVPGADCRYAQAAALTLAGLFLGYARPGPAPAGKLAAALLLFTPRVFFILGRGWTEPFVVMFLAATVFAACRRLPWPALSLALGLLLASKQYMVLALPLTFLLLPPPWDWRQWARAVAGACLVAAAVSVPLALWDWPAFYTSTVTVQRFSPFRWDALSYLVWLAWRDGRTDRVWLAFAALAPAMLLAAWRSPRNPVGFCAALTLILLTFFAFNKQAFCNYYFLVIGSACCGVAASHCPLSRYSGRSERIRRLPASGSG